MSYKEHAYLEFKAAGWMKEDGTYCDDTQEMMCEQVLELLHLFSKHGHSGFSAPYAINLFSKLAKFEPVVPLTGEDWEWTELDYGDEIKYQNKRCLHVFKNGIGQAYDSNGRVFWEWIERDLEEDEEGYPGIKLYKTHYTNRDSKVYIDFPYTPTTEYVERKSNSQ